MADCHRLDLTLDLLQPTRQTHQHRSVELLISRSQPGITQLTRSEGPLAAKRGGSEEEEENGDSGTRQTRQTFRYGRFRFFLLLKTWMD